MSIVHFRYDSCQDGDGHARIPSPNPTDGHHGWHWPRGHVPWCPLAIGIMRLSSRFLVENVKRPSVPERPRRSEAGDTLVEVLLAIVILGLASVAILLAFATSISGSAEH